MIERAKEIIEKSFSDRVDKGGAPYLGHLYRVSQKFEGTSTIIVALLHDLLEDCKDWNEEKLRKEFNSEICDAVVCLTKVPNEAYPDYIERVKSNRTAMLVKIADLEDNMDIKRLPELDEQCLKRLQKYHRTWKELLSHLD